MTAARATVVAATNRDLQREIAAGRFREDLGAARPRDRPRDLAARAHFLPGAACQRLGLELSIGARDVGRKPTSQDTGIWPRFAVSSIAMEAAELRELASGTMLDDKYRIDRLLAVGGMGAVYEGTHVKLRKRVAIKVLNPQLANPQMVERFHREAITASQIGHEGIAQVTDLGSSGTGEPFLVMELLEGESLAARLRTTGQLAVEVACELGCAILSPLTAAHAAGIVHRDLKPDNVFLVRQSRGEMVKLLDFGISRAAGLETEFRLTTTGLVLGTPYYMSPEQARGETAVGPAADLYAFGVMLYEMLIGSVPIKADNYNQLIYRVMSGDYARPRTKRPELPPALEDIVVRAMALEPTDRPGSAIELEHALLAFCRPTFRDHMIERTSSSNLGFKSSSPLLPSPVETDRTVFVPPAVTPSVTSATVAARPARRSRLPIFIAIGATIGITAAVVIAKVGASDPAHQTEAPTPVAGAAPTPTEVAPPPVATEPPPVAADPPTVAAPETITLHFAVEPTTAEIKIDGQVVDGSDLTVPKDGETHTVEIAADGFESHEEALGFAESQRLVVQLKREPKPTKDGRASAKPPKKPKDPKTERIDTKSPYDN